MRKPCPVVLCQPVLAAATRGPQPRGLSENCPRLPPFTSRAVQLGSEASPKATRTDINVRTLVWSLYRQMSQEEVDITFVRLLILVHAARRQNNQFNDKEMNLGRCLSPAPMSLSFLVPTACVAAS